MILRTPAHDRELLAVPDFGAMAALAERNRELLRSSSVTIDGVSLPDFRYLTRHELLGADPGVPVVVTGHQPELCHPGVWVKNFATAGLAARLGGVSVNLIVDSDLPKSHAIALPSWTRWEPDAIENKSIPFAEPSGDRTWETWCPREEGLFRQVPGRIAQLTETWGFPPLITTVWNGMDGGTLGQRFTAARVARERAWGCTNREIPASVLGRSTAFLRFARSIQNDAARFRGAYNAAVRAYRRLHRLKSKTHPVPELADEDIPFWHAGDRGREKIAGSIDPGRLRPRALTLTLFARLALGDLFIHGIGGGKYDAVTDGILREYYGIEPPAFGVVSATLRLPLPAFPGREDDAKRLHRRMRELHWNPHRFAGAGSGEHAALLAQSFPDGRSRYRAFRALGDRLRPGVRDLLERTRVEAARLESELAANAMLARRDRSWVLYPEALLKPYLQDVRRRAATA